MDFCSFTDKKDLDLEAKVRWIGYTKQSQACPELKTTDMVK
jgi:hypothetical protein